MPANPVQIQMLPILSIEHFFPRKKRKEKNVFTPHKLRGYGWKLLRHKNVRKHSNMYCV